MVILSLTARNGKRPRTTLDTRLGSEIRATPVVDGSGIRTQRRRALRSLSAETGSQQWQVIAVVYRRYRLTGNSATPGGRGTGDCRIRRR